MPLFQRRALLLAKIETTSGTDSVPVVGTDAMLARNVTLRPLVTQTADRAVLRGYMGGSEQLVVGEYVEAEFEIEAASAGTSAITVPRYGPLMRACGCAQTIGASDVTYAPISTGFVTATLYVYMDSVLHRLLGAVGDVRLVMQAGQIPVYRFRFIGMYAVPTDATPGAASFTGWQVPLGIRDANVPTLTVHSGTKAAQPVRSFEAGLGNSLVYRNLVGASACLITDRQAAGSIEIQAESVATRDWWTIVRNATTAAVSVVIGTGAGNVVRVNAPRVQMTDPQYSELDAIVMLQMGMRFVPNSGNDELVFGTA